MATSSLGALTIDVIARTNSFEAGMNKAERASAKFEAKVRKDMRMAGKAIAGLATGTAAAVAGMAIAYTNQANELTRLSNISNTAIGDFQKMAVGAKNFGIENDKLADILKDVNDKIGDYMQTGGGAMKDFFENIAPKVGVTAAQFRNLSGKDALQLYVKTLEDANVNQQDMTFYMEAIAGDATALLPLLKNNGEAMDKWGKLAEKTGIIMDENTAQAAQELGIQMDYVKMMGQGVSNQFMASLLPTVNEAGLAFFEMESGENAATKAGKALADGMVWLMKVANGVASVFEITGKAIASVMGYIETFGNLSNNIGEVSKDVLTQQVGIIMGGAEIVSSGFSDEVIEKHKKAQELVGKSISDNLKKIPQGFKDDIEKANDVAAEGIADIISTIEEGAKKQRNLSAIIEGGASGESEYAKTVRELAKARAEAEARMAALKETTDSANKDAIDGENKKGEAVAKTNKELAKQASELSKLSGSGYIAKSMSFLRQVEGFSSKPYWDVNAYRLGYGSDTVTRADGSVSKVTTSTRTNRADAERDLVRRLNKEFVPSIKRIVGAAIFDGLSEGQKVALIGLRYRGDLRKGGAIANGVKSGDIDAVVKAIRSINDKGNKGVRSRLNREAALFAGGGELSSDGFVREYNAQVAAAQRAAEDAEREAQKAQQELQRQIEATQSGFASLAGRMQTDGEKRLSTLKSQLVVIKEMQSLRDNNVAGAAPQAVIDQARNRAVAAAFTDNEIPKFQSQAQQLPAGFAELAKIDEHREKLSGWYSEQVAMLNQLHNQKLVNEQEYASQSLAIKSQLHQQEQALQSATQAAQLQAGQTMFGEMAGMARAFAGEQSGIYRAMFAMEKAFAIARAMMNIQTALSSAAASQPFPANLAAMATVATNVGAIVSNIASVAMPSGMAHDGIDSVPHTGTWLLEKGERVVTSQTSAKLDATLSRLQKESPKNSESKVIVNLVEDASQAGQTQERKDNGNNIIDVFVSNIMSDGKVAKALTQTYGLSRRGL